VATLHPTHNQTITAALSPASSPADILRRAACYLLTHGWRQGGLYAGSSHTPAACAIGAIGMAACGGRLAPTNPRGARPTYRAAVTVLHTYLHRVTGGQYRSIGAWNDAPGRTAAEVIAALHAAADDYDHTAGGGVR
jgi:hypothetical protein